MAIFEAFYWAISSSINLSFQESEKRVAKKVKLMFFHGNSSILPFILVPTKTTVFFGQTDISTLKKMNLILKQKTISINWNWNCPMSLLTFENPSTTKSIYTSSSIVPTPHQQQCLHVRCLNFDFYLTFEYKLNKSINTSKYYIMVHYEHCCFQKWPFK